MAFEIDNAKIRAYLEHLGKPARPGLLHILGVRGAIPHGERGLSLRGDTLNEWDDTVGVFGTDFALFKGTTDPGRHYTDRPMSAGGAAHLVSLEDGGSVYTYQRGLHRGNPGLVQAGAVLIRRDDDRDGDTDRGDRVRAGFYGLNIHRGGSEDHPVNRWSAGCQVIPADDFARFWQLIERANQLKYQYFLIEGPKFARWLDVL